MTRVRFAVAAIAVTLTLAACTENPPAQHAVAAAPPTSQLSPEPAQTTAPTTAPPAASTSAKATSAPKTSTPKANQRDLSTGPGCGQRAVTAGKFNPRCKEYQGYLDPGGPGRPKTSGEIQHDYLCQQGQLPKSEC
ncbi:hypothetical protein CU254_15000 [Amycolatopsis sp. AA4]|uniref:hypothetical protein n=1 Tax=Actinomycetes TaxID=1760 RepID=UPI0001B5557C|nr:MULTISPECIES: hypothetical protein [Actinomycetes]ATY11621.1 hypothetical protein CU254_15000 [Amycolatopsis sp. AA4]EFL07271.1 predicted protein [Streptomyces sp. AA4]